jgi:phenylacetate-CoA ligase
MAKIEADRDRAARRMALFAAQHVPFYRQTFQAAGLEGGKICGAGCLARLPLIDASTLRAAAGQFVAEKADFVPGLVLKTSGSSGQSREIPIDAAALFRNAAQGERERRMMTAAIGRQFGYREAVIVMNPTLTESSTPRVQRFLREHAFLPRGAAIERLYIDSTEPPASYLARLNEFRPDIIQSYGSNIQELIGHVASTGAPLHRPRGVYFHSSGISRQTRAALQDLGIPVFSTYEACEALKIGFECEAHEGYHVNLDTYPVRIVDAEGRDVEPGSEGRVVISNLSNRALVLLNYDLGDWARWIPGPCPCGRSLPRLELLEGSTIELITFPSGRSVNSSELYSVFLGIPDLWEYQVLRVRQDRFRLLLVVSEESRRRECAGQIGRSLRQLFGDDATFEVEFVERIPLSKGGKKRSYLPLGET